MRKINFQKDVLPHLVALVVFLTITIFFFQPVVFDSQSIIQGDITQWRGSAQELIEFREATGEEGLWTNSIFSGMPAYFVNIQWGTELIKGLHYIINLNLPHPLSVFFAALLSTYIMLLCFKVRPYLAIIGAVAFAFSSYNIVGITAGHNARIVAIAYMPMVIGGVHLCYKRNLLLGGSLTALAMALHLRANHLQITYYMAFVLGLYFLVQLYDFYKQKELGPFVKKTGVVALAMVLALGTFFGPLYGAIEFGKYSNRGASELKTQKKEDSNDTGLSKTYAFQYSNGIADPLTLFIPNILGGSQPLDNDSNLGDVLRQNGASSAQVAQYTSSVPTYWGKESPTTYYAGAIIVFLFVLGILYVDRKYVIWLVAVCVLGIVLSYGRNMPGLNYFFFDYIPGYSKFRSVTFTIILPILGMILLGMMALEKLLSAEVDKIVKRKVLIALGITGGGALLLALISGMFGFESRIDSQLPEMLANAVQNDRQSLLQQDALRSFAFIAAFAAVLYIRSIGKLTGFLVPVLLVAIPIVDTVQVAGRFTSDANYRRQASFTQLFPESAADKAIKSRQAPGERVLDLTGPFYSAVKAYHHHTINGYNGIRIRRYQDLIDNALIDEQSTLIRKLQAGQSDFSDLSIMNMLNTKFFIINPNTGQIVSNPSAQGPAWFVKEIREVNDADGEFNTTMTEDMRSVAVIDKSDFPDLASSSSSVGSIALTDYRPGYWKYETNNSGDGLAVFSEIYYPKGFEVSIDGEPVDMLRANYALRALEVPAGAHTVEFLFKPKVYSIGKVVMFITSLLAILVFFGAVYISLKPKAIA